MKGWEIMTAVTNGTEYLRENSETFLPLEPREDYAAYLARVNRAVFSPYTQRLIRAAAGLILRKPISIEGDPYWTEVFNKNVDGCGSDIDEYARRQAICALTYGHCHTLVDFPAPTDARTLAEERALNRRPYWIEIEPKNIYGWRLDRDSNYGSLTQVRIAEKAVVPDGDFGEKVYDQVRVIEPGRYRIYRRDQQENQLQGSSAYPNSYDQTTTAGGEYEIVEQGVFDLEGIPLITVYANKVETMSSRQSLYHGEKA